MKPFEYRRAQSLDEVKEVTSAGWIPLAGGTDLVPLMKDGLRAPNSLVDIKHAELPAGISREGRELVIGAMTTLSDIECSDVLRNELPLLSEAAALSATRQLRNRATLGGNLLQSSRCWYFRNPDIRCWLQHGDSCYAKRGRHDRHSLIGEHPCITVHPSDIAGCLLAVDARVTLVSASAERKLSIADLLTAPSPGHRQLHAARSDELLTEIRIPQSVDGTRTIYLKAMSRRTWSFALVGLALAVELRDGQVLRARAVLNGVAPFPWLLKTAATPEKPLMADELVAALADDFSSRATPMPGNAYKIPLAKGLMQEAVRKLTSS